MLPIRRIIAVAALLVLVLAQIACAEVVPSSTRPAASGANDPSEPRDPEMIGGDSPQQPLPRRPEAGRPTDAGKSPLQWQHATDDWFGLRPSLESAGVSVAGRVTADYSYDLSGGRSPGASAFRDLFNINITLDAEKLMGLHGGTLFVNFQNQSGDDGSGDVGDLQRFDNVDADGRSEISELWYEQTLLADKLRVRVGKIDPNAIFAAPVNGAEFLNSSMGISPTLLLPHYPDGSTGVQLLFSPTESFYLGGGVFDGSFATGIRTGEYGPAHLFKSPHDLSLLCESGIRWGPGGQSGRVAIGGWRVTADLPRFDGGTSEGTSGFYAMIEQILWKPNPADEKDKRGVAAFFQYGYADPRIILFTDHVGGGVAWTGPIPGRDEDVAGLGATWVRFAEGANLDRNNEWDVELFYKVQLTPSVSFKPDLQYIHNPGGVADRQDALVGTLRVMVDF